MELRHGCKSGWVSCLWLERSGSRVLRRLRPGGGALAFEYLQDALRILPDRADVPEYPFGRSVLRHPLDQPLKIEAAGTRCKALDEQRRPCEGGADYQQILQAVAFCNVAQDAEALAHLSDRLLAQIIFCDLPFAGLFCRHVYTSLCSFVAYPNALFVRNERRLTRTETRLGDGHHPGDEAEPGRLSLEPAATLEEGHQDRDGHDLSPDAKPDERGPAADVPHKPAEVLAEEAGNEGKRQEDGRYYRQLLHHDVESLETVERKTSIELVSRSRYVSIRSLIRIRWS